MNIKIIILGILLTALNANAENVNNCDSTCANNATINQMSSPMNTQTSTVGSGTVIQGNFYAVQTALNPLITLHLVLYVDLVLGWV